MIVGTVVLCVAVGLNALVLPVAVLLLVRCLQGAGFSWVGTALGTMASDSLPDSRMSEGIGYSGLSNTIAQAAAPGIVLWLLGSYGYRNSFAAILGTAVLLLVVCLTLRKTEHKMVS